MAGLAAVRVVEDAVMMRGQPRQQTRPHWGTKGRRAEGIAKPRPFPRDPVDVRRLVERRFSVQRRVGPSEIVGQDDDDIRTLGCR